MSGQVQKRNAQMVELLKSEFSNAGGVDPANHTHSKLVASDGAPDPALEEDASGFIIQHDDPGTGDAEYIFHADVDDWIMYPVGELWNTFFRMYVSGPNWSVELYGEDGITLEGDGIQLTSPQTSTSGDLQVGNDLDVLASAEIGGDLLVDSRFNLGPAILRTIAAGVITCTGSRHMVETQAGAATDNLDTINGFEDGMILILTAYDDTHDVVVTEAGNIKLAGGNFTMDTNQDTITLIYHTARTAWLEMSRSDNN